MEGSNGPFIQEMVREDNKLVVLGRLMPIDDRLDA